MHLLSYTVALSSCWLHSNENSTLDWPAIADAVQLLAEMLMGKRVEVNLSVGAYSRGFSGEQSPLDLETAFQLLYRLFTHRISPEDGDLATCLK